MFHFGVSSVHWDLVSLSLFPQPILRTKFDCGHVHVEFLTRRCQYLVFSGARSPSLVRRGFKSFDLCGRFHTEYSDLAAFCAWCRNSSVCRFFTIFDCSHMYCVFQRMRVYQTQAF